MKGIVIKPENISVKRLLQLISGIDNTFGPLGGGGYTVRQGKKIDNGEYFVFLFVELDCAPAHKRPVFMSSTGIIYVNKMAPVIMSVLFKKGFSFSVQSEAELPDGIVSFFKVFLG